MVYLFIGEDELSKERKIQALKRELFSQRVESFNCEVLYAKELSLPLLKESLSRLPVSAKNRLLVIKDIQRLRESLQGNFIKQLAARPENIVVVLEAYSAVKGSAFFNSVLKLSKVFNFRSQEKLNVFNLARAVERNNPGYALNLLAGLFRDGEKPEKILGGLRYQFSGPQVGQKERARNVRLLLDADYCIKTGRMKPEFALEALVVKLCR